LLSEWTEKLITLFFAGDAIMASAALDRLLHRRTIINIRGESFRLLIEVATPTPVVTAKEENAMT
jgi:hypothetical protein